MKPDPKDVQLTEAVQDALDVLNEAVSNARMAGLDVELVPLQQNVIPFGVTVRRIVRLAPVPDED